MTQPHDTLHSSHDVEGRSGAPFDALTTTRPDPLLLRYYFIVSLFLGPFFPALLIPMYFKYYTLRYRFDGEGIAMSWGILWRREVYLTYRRIQDIHVTRGIIQRWLGLATVSVQTASGSATPEAQIEGILGYDALRDFLYQKMRGAKGDHGQDRAPHDTAHSSTSSAAAPEDEALVLLREIRDALQAAAPGSRA